MKKLVTNYQIFATEYFNKVLLYSDKKLVAQITFKQDGTSLSSPWQAGDTIQVEFYMSRYDSIVDLLRYEKPISLSYYLGIFLLGTDDAEQVGEQEGV